MNDYPDVIPMIAYADGPSAMDWLAKAFGFRERDRRVSADGRLGHGEMETGHGVIMLATPSPEYQGPRRHREDCQAARRWQSVPYIVDGVLVYVDDIRAHFERAKAAGATILSELEETTEGKRYRAEDVEGHRWMFIER
ncbi:MAG: aminotransferase [Chloroflexi bacterium]|nr:MAG: aminotransferase [Chloroflexota bacterium]TME90881.1 MAG: aminotransferase [Chloroflexota bacterium]